MKKEINILSCELWSGIIRFALSIAAGSVIQQLFNSADTAIIGKFGESGALAAVGINGETAAMLIAFSAGLSVGVNVLISRHIGMNKREGISRSVFTSLAAAAVIGIMLAAAGQLAAKPLLCAMNTPAEILDDAVLYLRIYLLSVPFLMLYDFGAAICRAKGDSRRPLIALMASGAVNVLLNILFVAVLGLGVAGVAFSTVIAACISGAAVVLMLIREGDEFAPRFVRLDPKSIRSILFIGVPAALQGAVFSVANIFVQASVNTFGAEAAAGSAIAVTFEYLAYYAITSFGQAATTFISQNNAAQSKERCRRAFRICLLLSLISCAALTVPLTLFCSEASSLFTSSAAEIEMSCVRIRLILAFEPLCVFYEIPASALRGYGRSALPAAQTIVGICLIRIVWVLTVSAHFGTLSSLYIVFPITWVITSLLVSGSYLLLTGRN